MIQLKSQTKKGVASFYAVIFATLLFGVITIGFVRLILAESTRTINDDLSQSAYDAAIAGIEAAKAKILENNGEISENTTCNGIFGGKEVKLGSYTSGDYTIEQAYTCVLVYKTLDSYNTTLNNQNRARIAKAPSGADSIRVSWYSNQNSGDTKELNLMGEAFKAKGEEEFTPPVTVVTLVPETGDDVATIVLRPGGGDTLVDKETVDNAQNKDDGKQNDPIEVSCSLGGNYACEIEIESIDDLGYVVIDMPYGEEETDYRVEFLSGGSNIPLTDQQIKIDSTGRANDLFRRVEAYIDFSDQNFPYPEYGVYAGEGIEKAFWVTRNNTGWEGNNHGVVPDSELGLPFTE